MLTRTRTISVNAAFLQEIKEDNLHLRDLLAATAEVLVQSRSSRVRPKVLAELLARLRDQVATHFALEEAFGYVQDAVEVAPHLSSRADVLKSQHDALFLQICDVANDAEKLVYGESPARTPLQIINSYEAFFKRLQDHEACENELIMESLYEDIGVGD